MSKKNAQKETLLKVWNYIKKYRLLVLFLLRRLLVL